MHIKIAGVSGLHKFDGRSSTPQPIPWCFRFQDRPTTLWNAETGSLAMGSYPLGADNLLVYATTSHSVVGSKRGSQEKHPWIQDYLFQRVSFLS